MAYKQGSVTALAALTDNRVIRGDGGASGVQTSTIVVSDAGEMTNPSQPAFLAGISGSVTNVSGAGTVYTIIFNSEIYDQNSDFDSTTGVFTAPVTGKYLLTTYVSIAGLAAAMTSGVCKIVTSNRTQISGRMNPYACREVSSAAVSFQNSFIADMDAADTAYVTIQISSGAGDTATLLGAGDNTYFSGALIC